MLARVFSSAVLGIDAYTVEVEVDISNGLPAFNIVGLPDTSCRESADRVRSALRNSGFNFPSKKITVNLAPADLKKEGSAFDLPIALGILAASEVLDPAKLENKIFCGELALDGKLRPIAGILPRAVHVLREHPNEALFVPKANSNEAVCLGGGLSVYGSDRLLRIVDYLNGEKSLERLENVSGKDSGVLSGKRMPDFSEIKGQSHVKRGLEIAAAGGHNVLMMGPPGSGKTMLAKRVPSILSSMSFAESVETTKIHSVAGFLSRRSALVRSRPFRDPHHTISDVAMIGGGTHPKPGEVSLAHHGVLFLDELTEFRRPVLEVLRQPLEEGKVTISRAAQTLTLPARFMLIAAMNPCPCGYATHPRKECNCTSIQIKNYLSKVSGPLLDRIDIQLEVPCLGASDILSREQGESSIAIRKRVEAAMELQRRRYEEEAIASNAELESHQIERHCFLGEEASNLLKMAVEQLGFSARAYHKSLKVARTIADLEGVDEIAPAHVAEAIHYRSLDKTLWKR